MKVIHIITAVVAALSAATAILPPPDKFQDYPRFHAVYDILYRFASGIAMNGSLWKKGGTQ